MKQRTINMIIGALFVSIVLLFIATLTQISKQDESEIKQLKRQFLDTQSDTNVIKERNETLQKQVDRLEAQLKQSEKSQEEIKNALITLSTKGVTQKVLLTPTQQPFYLKLIPDQMITPRKFKERRLTQ